MKKTVFGSAILICGTLVYCTQDIIINVVSAMSNTTVVSNGVIMPLSIAVALLGLVIAIWGLVSKGK